MMGQPWVDAIMVCALEAAPETIGIGRTDEDDKRDAWALRYIACMVDRGVPLHFAAENYSAGEHDYSSDPESAAEDEMSYWDAD